MLKAVIKATMTLVVCTVAAVIGFIGIYWIEATASFLFRIFYICYNER